MEGLSAGFISLGDSSFTLSPDILYRSLQNIQGNSQEEFET